MANCSNGSDDCEPKDDDNEYYRLYMNASLKSSGEQKASAKESPPVMSYAAFMNQFKVKVKGIFPFLPMSQVLKKTRLMWKRYLSRDKPKTNKAKAKAKAFGSPNTRAANESVNSVKSPPKSGRKSLPIYPKVANDQEFNDTPFETPKRSTKSLANSRRTSCGQSSQSLVSKYLKVLESNREIGEDLDSSREILVNALRSPKSKTKHVNDVYVYRDEESDQNQSLILSIDFKSGKKASLDKNEPIIDAEDNNVPLIDDSDDSDSTRAPMTERVTEASDSQTLSDLLEIIAEETNHFISFN